MTETTNVAGYRITFLSTKKGLEKSLRWDAIQELSNENATPRPTFLNETGSATAPILEAAPRASGIIWGIARKW